MVRSLFIDKPVFSALLLGVPAKVLVRHLDHFCPWTGTTIGAGNIGSFYVLLTSFWAVIIDAVILLVYVLNFVDKS